MTKPAWRIVGVALVVASAAILALAQRSSGVTTAAIDDAAPAERVSLSGGTWDCEARIGADAALTVDGLVWIPFRGKQRTVLVGFETVPDCAGLANPAGKLRRISEHAYESLREFDTNRWAAVPQATLFLLFPRGEESRLPLVLGMALAIGGLALVSWTTRALR